MTANETSAGALISRVAHVLVVVLFVLLHCCCVCMETIRPAGMTVFVLLSVNTLAGVQSKVGQLLKDVVGTEQQQLLDPLAGPEATNGSSGAYPQPYVPFKGGAHVE